MKLLTFLGTNNYLSTTYVWAEKDMRKTTRLFPVALAEWLEPDEIVVFLTEAAEQHENWRELKDTLKATPVRIVDGASETGLWKIFESIVECVSSDDRLTIDITHGFRSLPLLGLLVAAYLKATKRVTVEHLVYGAYDARDKEKDESPVFELTSFLSLLDWMVASDHFLRTGYGRPLADLLSDSGDSIEQLKNSILQLSDGLHLLRPASIAGQAAQLDQTVARAAPTIAQQVPPLAGMLTHISESYGRFGADEGSPKQMLEAQLRMVDWYLERGQLVQALSLAREWLPSLLCVHFGVDVMDKREREDMELLLSGGKHKNPTTGELLKESPRNATWFEVPAAKRLRALWGSKHNLANLRNDVLHAGFRKNPKSPVEIDKAVRTIVSELKDIWNEFEGRHR